MEASAGGVTLSAAAPSAVLPAFLTKDLRFSGPLNPCRFPRAYHSRTIMTECVDDPRSSTERRLSFPICQAERM
jgi:hypothetical protein